MRVKSMEGRDGSFLYRFEAKLEFVPIGLVPEGLRMANTFQGPVTDGVFLGGSVEGIDHLLVRSDGVAVIDAVKTIRTPLGNVAEHVRGYCLPPEEMEFPPLEALLSPDFRWPDRFIPVRGSSTFQTGAPELAHLNRANARIDGWVNMATGALAVETHLLDPAEAVAEPGAGAPAEMAGATTG